jgi:peptidase E
MKEGGAYLLGGGRGSDRRRVVGLLREVVQASGVPQPRVAYVGAASADSPEFFDRMAEFWRLAGAAAVDLAPVVDARLFRRQCVACLDRADIVFASGGDVESGMEWIDRRGLREALAAARERGAVFAGLSAGSIMLARQWVRWTDPDDDDSAVLFDCLGLAPVLCDTHDEAGDWSELRAALRLCPDGALGYGIPGDGALRVGPDATVTALCAPTARYVRRGPEVIRLQDLPVVATGEVRTCTG